MCVDFVAAAAAAAVVVVVAAAAAAAAVWLVVSPFVVVLKPSKHQREVLGTSVRLGGFQVATSLGLLEDSERGL